MTLDQMGQILIIKVKVSLWCSEMYKQFYSCFFCNDSQKCFWTNLSDQCWSVTVWSLYKNCFTAHNQFWGSWSCVFVERFYHSLFCLVNSIKPRLWTCKHSDMPHRLGKAASVTKRKYKMYLSSPCDTGDDKSGPRFIKKVAVWWFTWTRWSGIKAISHLECRSFLEVL